MLLKNYKVVKPAWLFFIIGLIALLVSCDNIKRNNSHKNIPASNILKGKSLASIYCNTCHLLPDPSSLNARSWEEGVLPNMGPFLGIFNNGFRQYPSSRNDRNLDKNIYPSQALLTSLQWQYIIDYYTATSPDSLPGQVREKVIKVGLPDFDVRRPASHFSNPAVTFIRIDTVSSQRQVMLYDITRRQMAWFDPLLNRTDSLALSSPVVAAEITRDSLVICNVGEINPNNGKFGKLQAIAVKPSAQVKPEPGLLLNNLARPVYFQSADLNADGRIDYLVCEFGHVTGELSWFENTGDSGYQKHVLRSLPGAISTVINDYNKDGRPDIWALFAQGDEGIFLFTNKGHGQFEQEKIMSFPPMQGSTYFELADFNNDGYQDILYTCGDNADFSPVLKPYHGVYIFINNGDNRFTQKYFFPMHGCFKAMARDFDNDGDLDIAAISFFADYAKQPEEGFVYLKNAGHLDFEPQSFPESNTGRWLTMDAGDIDGDGKTDIILGNFSVHLVTKMSSSNWREGPLFIILKNITQ